MASIKAGLIQVALVLRILPDASRASEATR